ncbi:HMG box protein [Colletotrichum tofieldiae]|uniref:HMG box protein n=1 Tax=Colletotrichum tofieldiae TaxID=708197 RepID=A0A166W326_9PEZI|nr:HMG box protein [Colletotrichum tofieldiae]
MAQQFEHIFTELGIPQYLEICLQQKFDTWEAIVATLESDLYAHRPIVVRSPQTNDDYSRDALGIKPGYRRVSTQVGPNPDASLVSPSRATIEKPMLETKWPESALFRAKDRPVVTERKCRRHLRTDDNAPERLPSAYVLFLHADVSVDMCDELKG